MRARGAIAGVVLGCVPALGCGPSLHDLVADKHYREAVCAATDGTSGDRELVARALAADAELIAHVHAATAEELAPALGDGARPVTERAALVRVRVQSNVLPVDRLALSVSLAGDDGAVVARAARWETLAWATGERLPDKVEDETYLTGGNVLRGLAAIVTVGVSLVFAPFERDRVLVDAPPAEFQRVAPLAFALHDAMPPMGCQDLALTAVASDDDARGQGRAGQSCEGFFVVDRHAGGALTLVVEATYAADRTDSREPACEVTGTSRIALGPIADLEGSTSRIFGGRGKHVATP